MSLDLVERPSIVSYRRRQRTSKIILHDSHGLWPYDDDAVERWLRWRGRQMGMLDIGYHIVVGRKGQCIVTRPFDSIGNHAPGFNHESFGVCLIGGEEDAFPGEQMDGLKRLVLGSLMVKYQGAKLYGHTELMRFRRHRDRRCPCIDMDALREEWGL